VLSTEQSAINITAENGDGEFCRDQPPELPGYGLMTGNSMNNAVNDQFRDPQSGQRQEGADQPEKQPQGHDKRA
jgi:hypothetical protein